MLHQFKRPKLDQWPLRSGRDHSDQMHWIETAGRYLPIERHNPIDFIAKSHKVCIWPLPCIDVKYVGEVTLE